MSEPLDKTVSFRISEDLSRKVDDLVDELEELSPVKVTRSDVLRGALERGVAKWREELSEGSS